MSQTYSSTYKEPPKAEQKKYFESLLEKAMADKTDAEFRIMQAKRMISEL